MKKVVPLILLLAFAACRQTKDVTCDTGSFFITGVGFSVADFNGATISQYKTGTNFSQLVQSGNLTYYLTQHGSISTDSGSAYPPATMAIHHVPSAISTTFDYIISIPAVGISDTISNTTFLGPIHETMTYSDAKPAVCINQIGSYKFNSQTIAPAIQGQLYYSLYLVK